MHSDQDVFLGSRFFYPLSYNLHITSHEDYFLFLSGIAILVGDGVWALMPDSLS